MSTIRAFIRQYVTIRDDLRNWSYFPLAQATAANHEVAQAIQQAIVNVVFFWHSRATLTSDCKSYAQNC